MSKFKGEYNDIIPHDAVEVKITNIINPYIIRIQKIPINYYIMKKLKRMLQAMINFHLNSSSNNLKVPIIGDNVIILINNVIQNDKIDLLDYIFRGIIINVTNKIVNVFLLDYGVTIDVPNKLLRIYSNNLIPINPLTCTISLYNILPIDSKLRISTKWSKNSINFIKYLIHISKKIYFKILFFDKQTNKIYGDIFLVIANKIICLSKALINNCLAIPLHNDVDKKIKSSNNSFSYDSEKRTIINYNNNIKVKSEKNKINEKILIQTTFNCEPLEYITDSKFIISIHKALKNHGIHSLKHIQSYMWPAIKLGLNVVAISPKTSGKTIGYTIPIANCIAETEKIILENQIKDKVVKPLALILCASINKCLDVTRKFKETLYFHTNIKCFAAVNSLTNKQLMINIHNKFHLLISTPSFLLRLLKKREYSKKIDLSVLSYLVLDNADIILSKYYCEFMDLIKYYKIIDKNSQIQIINVSETWTNEIHSFVNIFMESPYICIGSFIEAAVFCRVKGRMLIRQSNNKKHEILDVLEDYSNIKTIIFCVNSEEAIELNNFLQTNCIHTLLAHEKMSVTKINELKELWYKYLPGMYPVIICTDQVLLDMQISNIEFLIHYTVTITSKTEFNRRFSVLMDNWLMQSPGKCRTLIIFDEMKETIHFKGVINILKRLNIELPNDWNEIIHKLDLVSNSNKINYPLCYFLKQFGICEDNSCSYRHRIIADVDIPKTIISQGDDLKLHITFIHNATHFSARVLECIKVTKENKQIISLPYEILELSLKMNKYYSNSKNRRFKKDIDVGIICVLKNTDKNFLRVQVLSILEKDNKSNKPKLVTLRCIDNGQIFERIYVFGLYEIPEEFLHYKLSIIDIFLTDILPIDGEYKWSNISSESVNEWFKKNLKNNSFVFAKVLLHIDESIWTDSLMICSKIIGYPYLINASLKEMIKKKELGIENKKHMINLLNLCDEGGLTDIHGYPLK